MRIAMLSGAQLRVLNVEVTNGIHSTEFNYKFPKPIPLEKRLKDYLEDSVDEKYYIDNEKTQKLIRTLIDNGTLQNTNYTIPRNNRELQQSRIFLLKRLWL